MEKLSRTILLFLIISVGIYDAFAQGPWSQGKNSGFIQLQTTIPFGPYDALIQDGESVMEVETNLNREVFSANFDIYASYGLTDKLTVFTKLPLKYVSTGNRTDSMHFSNVLDEGSLSGLGNYHLGLKYSLIDKQVKVAASVQSNWNTTARDLSRGLTTGYLSNAFGIYGHVGGSISERWYSYLDIGYNLSTNNYSDFTTALFEVGYTASKKRNLIIALTINSRQSVENGSFENASLDQTGLYTNDQEWVAYGLKVNYETKQGIGFNLSTYGLVSGNQLGLVGASSIGIYKKW